MAGYTRQHEADMVPDGIIRASHLNDEFDNVVLAFDPTVGHNHHGAGQGPAITYIGPGGEINAVSDGLLPVTTNTISLGANASRYKDLWLAGNLTATGNATIGGTLGVTGAVTFSTVGVTGNTTVGGTLGVTGATTVAALTVGGTQDNQNNTLLKPIFRDYGFTVNARGAISGAQSLDLTLGNYVTATIAGATTFTFSNPKAAPSACGFILRLTNGGASTVTWPAAVKWPLGTAPSLTASGTDVLVFLTEDAGTTWRGVQTMKDSR